MDYSHIIRKYKPRGWKVVWCAPPKHKSWGMDGSYVVALASPVAKTIRCPVVTGPETLFYFLHECGHVLLRHFELYPDPTDMVAEYEAERFALSIMRLEGVTVPRALVQGAKDNLRAGFQRFGQTMPRHVKRWIG